MNACFFFLPVFNILHLNNGLKKKKKSRNKEKKKKMKDQINKI